MEIDWGLITKLGLVGLVFFLCLFAKDILKLCRKPRLKINFSKDKDLRTWYYIGLGWVRKCATLHVENDGKDTAKRCVAILKIIQKPPHVHNIEDRYALHWAGNDYSIQTTGAKPVEIGPEPQRLDIVFTHKGQTLEGCWVAIPSAMAGALKRNQAYLSPGEYTVEIEIKCDNGRGDKAKFKITSPTIWNNMDLEKL